MHFLKENKQYMLDQLKGSISNQFHFTIKDLYKKDAHRIHELQEMYECQNCKVFLTAQKCIFCGKQNDTGVKENIVKNWHMQRQCQQQQESVQCMILMVDLSGSMNISYPSKYRKVNREYALRAIGQQKFDFLSNNIGEFEVIKNIKTIQQLLLCGQQIRDIAFSLKQELQRQKKKGKKQQKQENLEYMSRKEIIEVGVAQYISTIKHKRPNTIMTVVYFNSNIEYPILGFQQCNEVNDIQNKTMEEMINQGRKAAEQISLQNIGTIGDKLLTNMSKKQANGQTAMTPALAFCLGLADAWHHDLNQIVIVTDGLSNIGFGKTEEENQLEQSKKIFEQLAVKYAIKSNCVVNVISFQDCAIGYEVIDEVVKRTGGVPYAIGFNEKQKQKQKIITDDTINFLNFEMCTGFCESTRQFCFDNKLVVKLSRPQIIIQYPQDFEPHVKIKQTNWVSFDLGVKSVNQNMTFFFKLPQNHKIQGDLVFKVTVQQQYRRSKKINFIIREDIIKIIPGKYQQALVAQANVLTNQIKQRLNKRVGDESVEDYQLISKKLQKLQVVQTIDQNIIQKFNKKKAVIQEMDKTMDKLSRDKRSIQSRRKQTYNKRKYQEDDIFE